MTMIEEFKLNKELTRICIENDVKFLAVFGSVAKGDNKENSDIDLLVKFTGNRSLFKVIRFSNILSELLQKKVDLVTEDSLSKYIKKDIKEEMEIIYVA